MAHNRESESLTNGSSNGSLKPFFRPFADKFFAIFLVPYTFVRHPYSLNNFVTGRGATTRVVSALIEISVIQIFLLSILYRSILESNESGPMDGFLQFYILLTSVPFGAELYVLVTLVTIIVAYLPGLMILTAPIKDPPRRREKKTHLINLLLFYAVIGKIIEVVMQLVQFLTLNPLLGIDSSFGIQTEFLMTHIDSLFGIIMLALLLFLILLVTSMFVNCRKILGALSVSRFILSWAVSWVCSGVAFGAVQIAFILVFF